MFIAFRVWKLTFNITIWLKDKSYGDLQLIGFEVFTGKRP